MALFAIPQNMNLGKLLEKISIWILLCVTVFGLAFAIRMLEWPSWQNSEFRFGDEMLLATHDAYHWVAGATGYGLAIDHPMSVLLRETARIIDALPANAAFWLPPVMASLAAVAVMAWCALLGSPICGVAAGLMVSIAPGFLGRTLLGYYDTDLVTLLFPLCMGFIPAVWARRFVFGLPQKGGDPAGEPVNPLNIKWLLALAFSGVISWKMQEWHSVFPYLIRCNAILLGILALFAKNSMRKMAIASCTVYAFCGLYGWAGFLGSIIFFVWPFQKFTLKICNNYPGLIALWCAVLACLFYGDIFQAAFNHLNAYLKKAGDVHSSSTHSLIFPSVAQSIIEVQNLPVKALFPYFHPWFEAAVAGMIGFVWVLFRKPAALFLLPLAALGFSSAKLGGRMVMFGAPIVAIGLTMSIYWIIKFMLKRTGLQKLSSIAACLLVCAFFVLPYLSLVSSLSQGPILNRRHAAALEQAGKISNPGDTLWLWWDWGYAAQYFARRNTICDGAQHGGPSLYLPAAVFATDNPRFARQIIRKTSQRDNVPGKFFEGLNADQAQEMINILRSRQTPLVKGNGQQFLIVSFELLKLGFWISNYGNWNFITASGEGGALSIIPQALSYNLGLGEVRLEDTGKIIYPRSISVFEETGITERNYLQRLLDENPDASFEQQKQWLTKRRNINFLFNRVTEEKLAMDERLYNSLMVQLLLCQQGDQRYTPYFKLVYDNVFTRIYQVLPVNEEK